MKLFNYIALTLVIVGGINWGLVGAAQVDLVALIFGPGMLITNIIYVLVGVASIYCLIFYKFIAQTPDHVGINRDE